MKNPRKRNQDVDSIEKKLVKNKTENQAIEENKIVFVDFKNKKKLDSKKTNTDNIKTFITKDRDLLNQYYNLRHSAYKEENGWSDYDGSETQNDRNSDIVVCVNEYGEVVGGCRLKIARNENELLLNEEKGTQYLYRNFLAEIGIEQQFPCSESSSVVVAKDYRNAKVTEELLNIFAKYSVANGCKYMFGVAIIACCRDYRKVFKRLGYEVNIGINFQWKKDILYNFSKMFPMAAILN